MTRTTLRFAAAALGIATTGALGLAVPVHAAPVPTSIAAVNSAATGGPSNVQYRYYRGGRYWGGYRRGWGWGRPGYFGAGVVAGAVVGSALAAPYYYGPPAYYAPPAVVYGAPQLAPGSPVRQCWVDTDSSRNYGYWRPC
jgi:hypothetical protein